MATTNAAAAKCLFNEKPVWLIQRMSEDPEPFSCQIPRQGPTLEICHIWQSDRVIAGIDVVGFAGDAAREV